MQFTPMEALLTNQLFYMVCLFTLSGLLISNYWFFKDEDKLLRPSIYWPLSIIWLQVSFVSYLGMSISSSTRFMMIPGVGFTLMSILFLAFSIKEVASPVKKRTVVFLVTIVIAITIIFGILRFIGTFQIRTSIFSLAVIFLSSYSLRNISYLRKRNKSLLLEILFYNTILILLFAPFRLIMLWHNGLDTVDAEMNKDFLLEPFLATTMRWLWATAYIFSFFVTTGLYVERLLFAKSNIIDNSNKIQELLNEKALLMEKLVMANRVSEANALSVSLAHELNQPLCALSLNLEYLKRNISKVPNPEVDIAVTIQELFNDTQRASQVVTTLKKIFTNRESITSNHDLLKIIGSVIDLCKNQIQLNDIKVELEINKNYSLNVNDTEMIQVFINLFNNSIEALSPLIGKDKLIRIVTKESGGFKSIIFSDNGIGVPLELESKLFELLGTTREAGSGVGLWLSRYIVEKNGGRITHENNDLGGATFVMTFPLNNT